MMDYTMLYDFTVLWETVSSSNVNYRAVINELTHVKTLVTYFYCGDVTMSEDNMDYE